MLTSSLNPKLYLGIGIDFLISIILVLIAVLNQMKNNLAGSLSSDVLVFLCVVFVCLFLVLLFLSEVQKIIPILLKAIQDC